MSGPDKFRFSIDRGGTFTDIYAEVPGEPGYRVLKLLSENPDHYPDASIEGIRRILEEFAGRPLPMGNFDSSSVEWVRMGTTVATNALLEKKGARTGLLITRGFGDLLAIGKQNRPRLFDLEIKKPKPVYETVLEIDERIRVLEKDDPAASSATVSCISGDRVEILKPPNLKKIRGELAPLLAKGIESLAIVLMHSYIYPDHEIQIGELAREMGFPQVVLSSETMPRIKIVDRGQTACVDAYLTPHIRKYLNGFRDRFRNPRTDLLFMQSDGGLVRANRF
ncbi:MAG: 5-oxoprolinase, partial [Nitrospinae bacterium]|nr:5-oxoprolinase [Nitrospinota bacterium]